MWGREERLNGGQESGEGPWWPAMWCSEYRFRGVRRDHGCGVANAQFPFLVRWPTMWGSGENLSRWPPKGVGVNADLVACPAPIDVV